MLSAFLSSPVKKPLIRVHSLGCNLPVMKIRTFEEVLRTFEEVLRLRTIEKLLVSATTWPASTACTLFWQHTAQAIPYSVGLGSCCYRRHASPALVLWVLFL